MFWDEVALMFTEMNVFCAVLLVLGIIFCIVEMFTPGFGVFGILGGIMLITGIALNFVFGGTFNQMIALVFIIAIILIIALLIMIWSMKRGFLSKTPFVLRETALPVNYAELDKEASKLIGKEGTTITECRPVGSATFNEKQYEIVSLRGFLKEGVLVQVVKIEGNTIYVKPL